MTVVTPETYIKIRALADKLVASCNPSEFWDEVDALEQGECEVLDTLAFECSCCNQWYSLFDRYDDEAAEFTCVNCGDGS